MPDGGYSDIPTYQEREAMLHDYSEMIEHLKKTKAGKLRNAALRQLWVVNQIKSDPDDINHELDHEKYGIADACATWLTEKKPPHVSETIEHLNTVNPHEFYDNVLRVLSYDRIWCLSS